MHCVADTYDTRHLTIMHIIPIHVTLKCILELKSNMKVKLRIYIHNPVNFRNILTLQEN